MVSYTRQACRVYDTIFDQTVPVSSTRAAEMVKLLENTFRAINIGLANEVALMCERLDLDVWEVIEAAAAASMTSQTSRSSRSHIKATSFAKPILIARNVFSSNFTISAARVDETGTV